MKSIWTIYTDVRDGELIKHIERSDVQDWQFDKVLSQLRAQASAKNKQAHNSDSREHWSVVTKRPHQGG